MHRPFLIELLVLFDRSIHRAYLSTLGRQRRHGNGQPLDSDARYYRTKHSHQTRLEHADGPPYDAEPHPKDGSTLEEAAAGATAVRRLRGP